jgi:histidinol dehydrogenase
VIRKRLAELTAHERARLLGHGLLAPAGEPMQAARAIVERVASEGDAALRSYTKQFDRADVGELEVPAAQRRRAWRALTAPQRRALADAAESLARYHAAQRPRALRVQVRPGVVVGRVPRALQRVGLYAPGGRAAYPSSVLMMAVPARVAGVEERVLCSPPGMDGEPAQAVLAAAHLAEVERVFRVGGAQSIAAMALGTASVPRVDKVVGPGNAYVQAAKLLLQGRVGTDTPAGPSESLIVADAEAEPRMIARELLCQAEHGPDSCSIAVVISEALAQAAAEEVEELLPQEPRAAVIRQALDARGAILTAATLEEALAFSEEVAPEHLLLLVRKPERWLPRVRHAGSVFLGRDSAVALGDYSSGSNHVLPTGGAARWSSGLQVEDFVRWVTWQKVDAGGMEAIGPTAVELARLEGLEAHARSVEARLAAGRARGPRAPGRRR